MTSTFSTRQRVEELRQLISERRAEFALGGRRKKEKRRRIGIGLGIGALAAGGGAAALIARRRGGSGGAIASGGAAMTPSIKSPSSISSIKSPGVTSTPKSTAAAAVAPLSLAQKKAAKSAETLRRRTVKQPFIREVALAKKKAAKSRDLRARLKDSSLSTVVSDLKEAKKKTSEAQRRLRQGGYQGRKQQRGLGRDIYQGRQAAAISKQRIQDITSGRKMDNYYNPNNRGSLRYGRAARGRDPQTGRMYW